MTRSRIRRRLHTGRLLKLVEDPFQMLAGMWMPVMKTRISMITVLSQHRGYEWWQWSITMYHDPDTGRWTVDESLVP